MDDEGATVTEQTSAPSRVPPLVQEMVDEAHKATGIRPEVDTLSSRRWRVTVASERVVATADFRCTPSGRVRWEGGALTVDGEPRPTAGTYRQLALIFADPDGYAQALKVASLPPMPPATPVRQAPAQVQHYYHLVARHLSGVDMGEVKLGRTGNRWVICMESDRGTLRLNLRRTKTERSGLAFKQSLQLFVDDVDYSAQINGDLGMAMALLMDVPAEPSTAPATISSPVRSARSNAVEVRRATVIRT